MYSYRDQYGGKKPLSLSYCCVLRNQSYAHKVRRMLRTDLHSSSGEDTTYTAVLLLYNLGRLVDVCGHVWVLVNVLFFYFSVSYYMGFSITFSSDSCVLDFQLWGWYLYCLCVGCAAYVLLPCMVPIEGIFCKKTYEELLNQH